MGAGAAQKQGLLKLANELTDKLVKDADAPFGNRPQQTVNGSHLFLVQGLVQNRRHQTVAV
ncbi:MAG: hypothetical protein HC838_04880 [Spirulinaceae cyanobacterium RM2_2_10]|nr:hypothetical protein [Spirulinaceae cyanobacterium RM2_2_10]